MNRRTFLAAGGATAAALPMLNSASAVEPTPANLTKATVPTPALLVDLDAFEANVRKMAAHGQQSGRAIRPHTKTHKCPEIARRQIAAGAVGVCAATVSEAEAMVAAGIRGVLLTSPIVDPAKVDRMLALARENGAVMMSIGSVLQTELVEAAAARLGVSLDVLVDVDVGDRRTGSWPGEPALALAQRIAKGNRLTVRGVQAYAGHASHTVGFEARAKTSREALAKAVATNDLLRRSGFDARILSGGSTGTYNIDSEIDGVTELQVGSYVFMDVDYRRIGGRGDSAVYVDFQPSLTILATVVHAVYPDRVTVDAGTKGIDTTTAHRPEPKSHPGLIYNRSGDEFGALSTETGAKLPALGERVEFIVPHCDPSVNLYDRIYACRGDKVEAIWPVLARRQEKL